MTRLTSYRKYPSHQKLPSSGMERETLRQKGQFWTPSWVAEAMVEYVLLGGSNHLFDPAIGEGAFFRATKNVGAKRGRTITLMGTEIDPKVLNQARESGLTEKDLSFVEIRDFIMDPPAGPFAAIAANPPYIRHHRLSKDTKAYIRKLSTNIIGRPLDGRAGLHIYFFICALKLLDKNGRLAFILPADTCEGVFAPVLWNWIADKYCIDAVITFTPEASPFPGVDTNAMVVLIRNSPPNEIFYWVKVQEAWTDGLIEWISTGFRSSPAKIKIHQRSLTEALATGLSRTPNEKQYTGPTLGDFASVLRGIATGANEFFFLTRNQAKYLHIPSEFLLQAVGRTRDVTENEITLSTIEELEKSGRPSLLLSLDGRPENEFPESIRKYLARGEEQGLPKRALIAQRRPWYKMEKRQAPPFLFAYLGRRNARFIRNSAGVIPLTGFLCVYPHDNNPQYIERLWKVLTHPEISENLTRVGKSYGSGAIKVEPRALERLPLPEDALCEVGLKPLKLFVL